MKITRFFIGLIVLVLMASGGFAQTSDRVKTLNEQLIADERELVELYYEFNEFLHVKNIEGELKFLEETISSHVDRIVTTYETLTEIGGSVERARGIAARSLLLECFVYLKRPEIDGNCEKAAKTYYRSYTFYEHLDIPHAMYKNSPYVIEENGREYSSLEELKKDKGQVLDDFGFVSFKFIDFSNEISGKNLALEPLEKSDKKPDSLATCINTFEEVLPQIRRNFNQKSSFQVILPVGKYAISSRDNPQDEYEKTTEFYVSSGMGNKYLIESLSDWFIIYEDISAKAKLR